MPDEYLGSNFARKRYKSNKRIIKITTQDIFPIKVYKASNIAK